MRPRNSFFFLLYLAFTHFLPTFNLLLTYFCLVFTYFLSTCYILFTYFLPTFYLHLPHFCLLFTYCLPNVYLLFTYFLPTYLLFTSFCLLFTYYLTFYLGLLLPTSYLLLPTFDYLFLEKCMKKHRKSTNLFRSLLAGKSGGGKC